MAIIAIRRDWADNVSIVRMISTDSLSTVASNGYLTSQIDNIEQLNNGPFDFLPSDLVLVYANNGFNFFTLNSTFSTLSVAQIGVSGVAPAQIQNQSFVYSADTGTANTYVATPSPAVTALVPGLQIVLNVANANTGASTLAVSGLTAKAITSTSLSALTAGQMGAGMLALLEYDGTEFQLLNPVSAGGSGPWTASGTDSAVGGDGTSVASGSYSLSYGNSTNTVTANNSYAFGTANNVSGNDTIVAGNNHTVSGHHCAVFGNTHTVSGVNAFVWGRTNTCDGDYSFAGGYGAVVTNDGSVVWGDSNITPNTDTIGNQFNLTFAGGYRLFMGSVLAFNVIPTLNSITGGDGTCTTAASLSICFGTTSTIGASASHTVAFGSSHNVNGPNCAVFGFLNSVVAVADAGCFISGESNEIRYSPYSVIFGNTNEILGQAQLDGNTSSYIFGDQNVINNNLTYCYLFGNSNTIGGHLTTVYTGNWLVGNTSAITECNYAYSFGNSNTTSSGADYSFCFGNTSTVDANATYAWAIGNNALVTNSGSIVWGDSNINPNTDTASNQFALTFAGGYYFYENNTPTVLAQFTPTGSSVIGTNTNNNAASGYVGEYITQDVLISSAVSLTNNTPAMIASIPLTPGDWDIGGKIVFDSGSGTTVTILSGDINPTSAAAFSADTACYIDNSETLISGGGGAFAIDTRRISISSNATYYLNAYALFGTSTLSAAGRIWARRAR